MSIAPKRRASARNLARGAPGWQAEDMMRADAAMRRSMVRLKIGRKQRQASAGPGGAPQSPEASRCSEPSCHADTGWASLSR
jgi:hypothetical protein